MWSSVYYYLSWMGLKNKQVSANALGIFVYYLSFPLKNESTNHTNIQNSDGICIIDIYTYICIFICIFTMNHNEFTILILIPFLHKLKMLSLSKTLGLCFSFKSFKIFYWEICQYFYSDLFYSPRVIPQEIFSKSGVSAVFSESWCVWTCLSLPPTHG